MKLLSVALLGLFIAIPAWADSSDEAIEWLRRVAMSTRGLSYNGTFVYQCGSRTETSHIAHVADGDNDMEHIEMLDGSPREVVRIGDEVKTYLPESRRVVIERRIPRPHFPSMLPTGLTDLTEYYTIRRGTPDRVAGIDSQPVMIDPRDSMRYRRQLWVDRKSGLLLKAETFNEAGQPRESISFTEVRISDGADRDAIKARFNRLDAGWKVQDVRISATAPDDDQWRFHVPLPGFHRVAGMTRRVQADAPVGTQLVFSDGLAAISVFIEQQPVNAPQPALGQFSMGAVNVYKRILGDHLLVLMGDVPPAALKKFGDGIEAKNK